MMTLVITALPADLQNSSSLRRSRIRLKPRVPPTIGSAWGEPPLSPCCVLFLDRSPSSAPAIGYHYCAPYCRTMQQVPVRSAAQATRHLLWLSVILGTQSKAAQIQPCALSSIDSSFCRPIHDSFPGPALHIGFVAGGEDRWPDLSTALISLLHHRSCPLHVHFYADRDVQTLIEEFFQPAEYASPIDLRTCPNAPAFFFAGTDRQYSPLIQAALSLLSMPWWLLLLLVLALWLVAPGSQTISVSFICTCCNLHLVYWEARHHERVMLRITPIGNVHHMS